MKTIIIYDDTGRKSEVIQDIIGEKGFADVVVKKRCLEDYYKEEMEKIFSDVVWQKIHSVFEYVELLKHLDVYNMQDVRVIHCFSNYIVSDARKARLSFEKLAFIDEPFGALDGNRAVAALFPDLDSYKAFCKNIIAGRKAWDLIKELEEHFNIDGMVDIGIIGNFIQCVTGNFDSRYFNSLKGNEYTLVKSSTNKKKIKAEYDFYHLLPEDMKYWFVMPFDYKEDDEKASYTMERLHMTDLAIKWVHGSMEKSEFETLMDKYFYFFKCRHSKACSDTEYKAMADELYINKVDSRIADLKKLPEYKRIDTLLSGVDNISIDDLLKRYYALKDKIEARNNYPKELVIGHGDPCFANTLYNKSTQTLKFIDPKGASKEEDLWTNPYYDIAKLSHSVCGKYDFFNNGLFDIRIAEDFSYDLEIPFDNSEYMKIFKAKVEENGFDYLTVRIYEASLFISMLPLHIDNPHKVFGFILNVDRILKEIEADV
ncbi:hypothetical protein SAMN04487831_103280 [Pseudobutyrivibrio sp. UC1225]|uniref:hypothetical protein n=1 Tax=Pseudobutyrivibrio sp. UC1225 TaxID=1798185 RepID=UPI0008E9EF43|nr:hypothetical protein [Pseudobutyrivibrio sp. UC1225]SFN78389.1 hypothetical protein SAMN04487831_103280 [Pseudobutyrivibrio sp. UC1225]